MIGTAATGVRTPAPAAPGGGLLRRPAAESVRRILLATLERIEEAEGRLRDEADAEVLHDFRVGVRRLRSALRAFRPLVEEDLPGRTENRLRGIARATNRGRDAEVQATLLREWLRRPLGRSNATASARAAALRLAQELEGRRDQVAPLAIAAARRGFLTLAASLRRRLAIYRVTVDLGAGTPQRGPSSGAFAAELSRQVLAQWLRLREGIAAVEGPDPPEALHRVRIEAKRLRYLLEPLRDEEPELDAPLRALRSWQDRLGEFQDAVVLQRSVAKRAVAAARRRARALVAETVLRGGAGAAERARRLAPVSPRAFLPLLDLARAKQRRAWRVWRRHAREADALERRLEELCANWSVLETRASGG